MSTTPPPRSDPTTQGAAGFVVAGGRTLARRPSAPTVGPRVDPGPSTGSTPAPGHDGPAAPPVAAGDPGGTAGAGAARHAAEDAARHAAELAAVGSAARHAAELAAVEERLGRPARGAFAVVVVDALDGAPVVIRNEPLLADGTPMPTRYWLVDPDLGRRIGTLENAGGVRRSEAEVDPDQLAEAHRRYAAERDAHLPEGWRGPRPSGGVGGTRRGVKCLHTHYAHWLATGDDPVGAWVEARLAGNEEGPGRRSGVGDQS